MDGTCLRAKARGLTPAELVKRAEAAARVRQKMNPRPKKTSGIHRRLKMAGWTGLEPAAFCVTGRRSNQLSYHPK